VALYVKDAEVDRLAERLAMLQRATKTEVVRQALLHELERVEGAPSLVERGVAFVKALKARARPEDGEPADKDYIDGLYGQP
jgi:antitoxin VapB